MGNGSSLLPTEQDYAPISDTTLAALKSLPEGSQRELAALYKLREMAEPEVVKVSTPRVAPALGLKWRSVGSTAPSSGRELTHAKFSFALRLRKEFTAEELAAFELPELKPSDYIKWESYIFDLMRRRRPG